MKAELTNYEERMRRALFRELRKPSPQHIVPERVDQLTKHWVIARTQHNVTILEGKLTRNVWSGDVTISFRRITVES